MAEPLSCAAQAVLHAFNREVRPQPHHQREAIAAAICAAAGQVVPPALEVEFDRNHSQVLQKAVEIKSKLLSIAFELDGTDG